MNNRFQFIGRISKDLEIRTTSSGKSVLDVNLAVNIRKEETLFATITYFGNYADTINKYCKKGDLIAVGGIVKNHNWEDKNGNKHYEYQFLGNDIQFLALKKEKVEVPQNIKTDYQEKEITIKDEDLPF